MASPASPNITIYLTPEEAKKINNNFFLGRETVVFSDAEMARLRRPERVIYLGNYYPPMESISFETKKRELGVDFVGMHNPEDFLDLEADKDVGIIAENAKLARLAEGKGWHSVEVANFNPFLGVKVAFLGSSENLGRYRGAISKYEFKDLGLISAEDIPKMNPLIIVMDKRDDKAVLTARKNFTQIWQLDRLLSPLEIGRCSSLPESGRGKDKKIGDGEDHRKVTCENFLFDRLYRHPALPVPLPHPIDEKKAQEWIKAHPEKYREMAKDFIQATHHVSFSEFYANLRRSTLAALEKIGDRPFALLIAIEEGVLRKKSNYWVSQLVWDFFEEEKKFPADVTDSVASTARKYPQIRDFIIADDAAYSGIQMRAALDRQLENVLREEDEDEEEEAPIWDIHLVIPYISERAARVISPKKTWSNQFRLFLYSQVKMAKLSEILSPEVVERMSIEGFIDGDRWPYYFDHKIADGVSSYPKKYGWGRIAGTDESIRFLENCYESGCYDGYYKRLF